MIGLYRVTVPVNDLDGAVRFYKTLFGEDGERITLGWHYFRLGQVVLACHDAHLEDSDRERPPAHVEPIYLAVDEPLLQLYTRAEKAGAKDLDPDVRTLPTGEHGFMLRDPFGNTFCIVDARTSSWRPSRSARPVAVPRKAPDASLLVFQRDFVNAVKGGEIDRVKELLALDPDLLHATDSTGVPALLLAAYKRHNRLAHFLLAMHEELSVWEAAAFGQRDKLAAILDKNVELLNSYSVDGFTPLGLACFFGHPVCVNLLLERRANANAPSRQAMRVQPLHSALSQNDALTTLTIVNALLDAGADVNATQQGGYTPLHQAADRGSLVLVERLLDAGANPRARAENGRAPGDLARPKGHTEVWQRLGRAAKEAEEAAAAKAALPLEFPAATPDAAPAQKPATEDAAGGKPVLTPPAD